MTLKLILVEDGTRSDLAFDGDVLCIGRAIDNDLRIEDTLVSRHHCRIERSERGLTLVDLESANGTQVNGERVRRRHQLLEGDQLVVGRFQILVERAGSPELEGELDEEGVGGSSEEIGARTITEEQRRERRNLEVFANITKRLARETEEAPLLRVIVDSAVSLVGAERGFLLLAEPSEVEASQVSTEGSSKNGSAAGDGGDEKSVARLTVRLARTFEGADIPVPRSRLSLGVAGRVFAGGEPVLSVDAGSDARFDGMKSVEDLRLRSVMCLPVLIEGRIEGVLYVDNRLQQNAFTREDLKLAMLFADQVSIAILNARRVATLEERNRVLERSRRQIELLNEQLGRKVRDRDTELAVVRAELGRERGRYDYTALIGASDGMRRVFQQLDRIVESELLVLVTGESGTGKELIARAIHYNGPRKEKPFVTENCAALPDTLLESELFGHERGAFTGAHRTKKGLFEQADGGTLFLDEIGDMSAEMQKKLLRALQEKEFRPLGSDRVVKADVRLLAASHRNLEDLVRSGEFREDLYYRVNVLVIALPPLRERRDDIPLLADHLLARAAREASRPLPTLPHEVVAALVAHDWPGNVRELENEMRRLVVLARDEVTLDLLSPSVLEGRSLHAPHVHKALQGGAGDIKVAVAELEKSSILAALSRHEGNKSRAAQDLGISRFALQRKLEKYGIGATDIEAASASGVSEDESGTGRGR